MKWSIEKYTGVYVEKQCSNCRAEVNYDIGLYALILSPYMVLYILTHICEFSHIVVVNYINFGWNTPTISLKKKMEEFDKVGPLLSNDSIYHKELMWHFGCIFMIYGSANFGDDRGCGAVWRCFLLPFSHWLFLVVICDNSRFFGGNREEDKWPC